MGKEDPAPRREPATGSLTDFRFGAIAVWGGLVSPEALDEALAEQAERRSRLSAAARLKSPQSAQAGGQGAPRVGEMLVRRGRLTDDEARRVLRVQLQRVHAQEHRLFGPIAVARRFATPQAVSRALDEQSREILAGGEVRHLGDVLAASGAILPREVDAIFAYQAKGDSVPMSEARRRAGPGKAARADSGDGTPAMPRRDGQPDHARPGFLPRGARGFLLDNSIWIIAALAAALAAGLAFFREAIF